MDDLSVSSATDLCVRVGVQSKNRKLLTQDISERNTMAEECSQNKLFGYLLDRFCVGWICFSLTQRLAPLEYHSILFLVNIFALN